MARLARVSLPEVPYHITCRGNRRAPVFLAPDDRDAYIAWLGSYARRHGLEILAWCLMTNHVHLVAVPARPNSLASALGHAHGKYAQWFNARHGL